MTFLTDLEDWGDARDAAKRDEGYAAGATSRQAEVDRLTTERDAEIMALAALQTLHDAYVAKHPDEETLVDLDLSTVPLGTVTGATLAAEMGCTTTANGALANMSIGADPDGRKYVQTTLKANTFGGSSGSSSIFKLPKQVTEATITYEGVVSPNFQAVKGGKLGPGLAGVVDGYPPGLAAGNQKDPDAAAMSMRVMFRPLFKLVSYIYHFGQARAEGDDVPWSAVLTPGQPFVLEQHHRLNDPGQANGVLEVWFNGTKVLDVHDFVYRRQDRANLLIGYVYWSIFFGGNTLDWAASVDTWVRIYDGLRITTP